MRHIIAILLIPTLFSATVHAEDPANRADANPTSLSVRVDSDRAAALKKLSTSHESTFAQESVAVTFRAELASPLPAESEANLALVALDSEGKIQRYIAKMRDDGLFEDGHPGDGVYSKKIHINEKTSGHRYYSAVLETADGLIIPEGELPRFTVNIIARPTFIQVMKNVWNRMISGKSESMQSE